MSKRKNQEASVPSKKNVKAKKVKSEEVKGQVDQFQRVADIYRKFREDRKNLNDLLVLLNIFQTSVDVDLLRVTGQALSNIFKTLLEEAVFTVKGRKAEIEGEAQGQLSAWLSDIYGRFKSRAFALLTIGDLQEIAFNSVMQLIRLESFSVASEVAFPMDILESFLKELTAMEDNSTLLELFDEAVNSHRDIRYYTLRILTRLSQRAREDKDELAFKNIFKILSEIVMENDAEIASGQAQMNPLFLEVEASANISSVKAHLQEFSGCWLEFLMGMPLVCPQLHRSFLIIVNERVIPYMIKPNLLADYLTDSYNAGGLVSLLALNGLFTLMHKHNLDYPSFFPKLYSLLVAKILHCRYRKRFCKLFGLFMTSTHMPAYLVAAFVKRMSRLSLDASPAALTWILPFIYNMFKAHPAVRVLIHRQPGTITDASKDPFIADEADPAKCRAIDSSLWEIHALSRHYWTGAVKLSKLFTERLTKPTFDLNEYLEGPTYSSLIKEELAHKWSKLPPLNINIPDSAF